MWNKRYNEPGYAYGKEPNDFLVSSVHRLKPGSNVLCLAEGEGRNAVFLAELGFQVTAVDSSKVGLKKAHALAAERGVSITTELADLAEYQLPAERYDAVVSIFCHLPPSVRAGLHKQIFTSLNKCGILILEAFSPKQLKYGTGGPQSREMLMDLKEVKAELEPLYLFLARETEREIHEGSFHCGLGAVIQIIGNKSAESVKNLNR